MSATLPFSGLQVHQEIVVQPPDGVPDCSDYPDDDVERCTCLMLRESLPEQPERTDITTLRAGLPDKLMFAEDFDGDLVSCPVN